VYRKLCELGFYLRFNIPKQFGGLGITDYRYNTVIVEETGTVIVEPPVDCATVASRQ